MNAWLKIASLGLVIGAFAAGCTITSDDDDDGIGGANTSGGSDSGGSDSGGSDSGGSGATDPTGGSAGAADGGAGNTGPQDPNVCEECLTENCGDELTACGDVCITEYVAIQDCLEQEYNDNGTFWDQAIDGCAAQAADDIVILTETNELVVCTQDLEADANCSLECFDFAEGEGGAGGS